MASITRYVVGFLLTPDLKKVVLLTKRHPNWMSGFLNGLGGKAEDGETPLGAVVREVLEESGVGVDASSWLQMKMLKDIGRDDAPYELHYFCASDAAAYMARTTTDEEVRLYELDGLREILSRPNRAVAPDLEPSLAVSSSSELVDADGHGVLGLVGWARDLLLGRSARGSGQ